MEISTQFDFDRYAAMRFTNHYRFNIVPDEMSDDEYLHRAKMVTELIQAGHFDYCTTANSEFVATPSCHHPEVYNLIQSTFVLPALVTGGTYFNTAVIAKDFEVPQRCHAVSALTYMLHPSYEIYTGISDRSNVHSWNMHKHGVIYDNTGLFRETYFGIKVPEEHLYDFISPLVPAIREIAVDSKLSEDDRARVEAYCKLYEAK